MITSARDLFGVTAQYSSSLEHIFTLHMTDNAPQQITLVSSSEGSFTDICCVSQKKETQTSLQQHEIK